MVNPPKMDTKLVQGMLDRSIKKGNKVILKGCMTSLQRGYARPSLVEGGCIVILSMRWNVKLIQRNAWSFD